MISRRLNYLFSIGLALVSVLGIGFGVRLTADASDDTVLGLAAPTAAILHNPTFDNYDWYFFHERYDPSYPPAGDGMRPILPDDDNNTNNDIPIEQVQDWRLWYVRGTPLIQTFSETGIAQSIEAVAVRTYEGDIHQGGLYQMVYNTTPCLLYNFQMYALSKPDSGSPAAALKVGIDSTGAHPDTEGGDPAVGSFPSTTVWGPAHDYKYPTFGPLTVTVEARADEIAVFTYADTTGGRRHAIVWDTGSLQDVTPATIHDPDDLPAPGGTSVPTASAVNDSATINWTTSQEALGQVYYRLLPTGGTAQPGYPNKVFLPFVSNAETTDWSVSSLNKTPTTNHSITLFGLLSGHEYEFRVVSRGLSGNECSTWTSDVYSFTMP